MNRICLFIKDLRGGGAERVAVNLARGFYDANWEVELLLINAKGPLLQEVPEYVKVVEIGEGKTFYLIPWLINYIKIKNFDIFMSFLPCANILMAISKLFVRRDTHYVITEHSLLLNMTLTGPTITNTMAKLFVYLCTKTYIFADSIIAVSKGLADHMTKICPSRKENIHVIYNPIVTPELLEKGQEPLDYSWFHQNDSPIIIGIGSLNLQKDFATLINAFAKFRARNNGRLVILGDGPLRQELIAQAERLGIVEYFLLPGYVNNPYKYLARSSILVHSSRCEGFSNVLAEALALGIPVVSTDCPCGPREILEDGKYGKLVSIGDSDEMAEAIEMVLKEPLDKQKLINRAQDFSVKRITDEYIEFFNKIKTPRMGA